MLVDAVLLRFQAVECCKRILALEQAARELRSKVRQLSEDADALETAAVIRLHGEAGTRRALGRQMAGRTPRPDSITG